MKRTLKVFSTSEVIKKWLDFFQQKNYRLFEPASLIPQNDPSLLWINSGVAALKKYFNNPASAPARNMVNCQKKMTGLFSTKKLSLN